MEGDDDKIKITEVVDGTVTAHKNGTMDLFATFEQLEQATTTKSTITENDHLYQFVDTPKAQRILVENLLWQQAVGFDTETTSLNELEAELIGMSFCYKKGLAYYVPMSNNQEEAQKTIELFRPFFEDQNVLKIAHNLKYDYKVLKNYNIEVEGKLFDTMVAHYLLNPDGRHGMDYLTEMYLDYKPVSIE